MKKITLIGSLIICVLIAGICAKGNVTNSENEDLISYYREIAEEQARLGAYGTAIKYYSAIVDLENTYENQSVLIELYSKNGQVGNAIELLEQVNNAYPYEATPYLELAEYYYQLGDYKNTILVVERAYANEITTEDLIKFYYDSIYQYDIMDYAYDYIYNFQNGYAVVRNNDQYGLIGTNAKTVVPIIYDFVSNYSGEMIAVSDGEDAYFIDLSGKKYLATQGNYKQLGMMSSSRAIALNTDNQYCYVNSTGKEVLGAFQRATDFYDGVAAVYMEERWKFIDVSGTELFSNTYDEVKLDEWNRCSMQKRMFVKEGSVFYMINNEGERVTEQSFEDAKPFYEETITAVKQGGKWGFIDTEGTIVIEPQYEDAQAFGYRLAAVKKDGKWGFIDRAGVTRIEFIFDDAKIMSRTTLRAPVKMNNKWYVLRLFQ